MLGLLIVAGTVAHSQDPAAADHTPQQVLKGHGLEKSGTTWVLLSAEKGVLSDLAAARGVYRQVSEGMMRQQAFAMGIAGRKNDLQTLRMRNNALGQQIAVLDQELNALVTPPGGNNFVTMQRNQLSQQRNALTAENNQVVNMLNALQEQARDQGQDQQLQLNAEVAERREKFMQAVFDLRKSVDELTAKYEELAGNQEVTQALSALSKATRSKQKLGPSVKVRDAIKLLQQAESTVQSDNITLHRENGVFHVYATLGRVPTKMVFDTGAGLTTISAKLADRIGLRTRKTDPTIQLKTADGTVVEAKHTVIPSVRVGKFAIPNVECAVMPAEKGDVDPLLGQTFFKYFKVEFNAEAGKLNLKKLELDASVAEAPPVADATAKPAGKAAARGRRGARPRTTARSKKSAQPRTADAGGDTSSLPADGASDPD